MPSGRQTTPSPSMMTDFTRSAASASASCIFLCGKYGYIEYPAIHMIMNRQRMP
jgi:hypothetical protein